MVEGVMWSGLGHICVYVRVCEWEQDNYEPSRI